MNCAPLFAVLALAVCADPGAETPWHFDQGHTLRTSVVMATEADFTAMARRCGGQIAEPGKIAAFYCIEPPEVVLRLSRCAAGSSQKDTDACLEFAHVAGFRHRHDD